MARPQQRDGWGWYQGRQSPVSCRPVGITLSSLKQELQIPRRTDTRSFFAQLRNYFKFMPDEDPAYLRLMLDEYEVTFGVVGYTPTGYLTAHFVQWWDQTWNSNYINNPTIKEKIIRAFREIVLLDPCYFSSIGIGPRGTMSYTRKARDNAAQRGERPSKDTLEEWTYLSVVLLLGILEDYCAHYIS